MMNMINIFNGFVGRFPLQLRAHRPPSSIIMIHGAVIRGPTSIHSIIYISIIISSRSCDQAFGPWWLVSGEPDASDDY